MCWRLGVRLGLAGPLPAWRCGVRDRCYGLEMRGVECSLQAIVEKWHTTEALLFELYCTPMSAKG